MLSAVAYRGFSVTREYNAPKDSEVGHGGAFFYFALIRIPSHRISGPYGEGKRRAGGAED